MGQSGPEPQRPVILPPLEADGNRCSVKPASRIARRSRYWGAIAFATASTAHYATWNGRAADYEPGPGPCATDNIRTTLMPPLGLQAGAAQLGEADRVEWIFKMVSFALNWRCGTKPCVNCDGPSREPKVKTSAAFNDMGSHHNSKREVFFWVCQQKSLHMLSLVFTK
jgi:hypothetical protein